jgi:predicted ATPase
LRTTIAWSHGRLSDAEQALLARLSVFNDTWTVNASATVGTLNGDLNALETLASLVAQSLVRTDESDPAFPEWAPRLRPAS